MVYVMVKVSQKVTVIVKEENMIASTFVAVELY